MQGFFRHIGNTIHDNNAHCEKENVLLEGARGPLDYRSRTYPLSLLSALRDGAWHRLGIGPTRSIRAFGFVRQYTTRFGAARFRRTP